MSVLARLSLVVRGGSSINALWVWESVRLCPIYFILSRKSSAFSCFSQVERWAYLNSIYLFLRLYISSSNNLKIENSHHLHTYSSHLILITRCYEAYDEQAGKVETEAGGKSNHFSGRTSSICSINGQTIIETDRAEREMVDEWLSSCIIQNLFSCALLRNSNILLTHYIAVEIEGNTIIESAQVKVKDRMRSERKL